MTDPNTGTDPMIFSDDFILPFRTDPASAGEWTTAAIRRQLDAECLDRLNSIAMENNSSLFALIMTLYGKVITRFSGCDRYFMKVVSENELLNFPIDNTGNDTVITAAAANTVKLGILREPGRDAAPENGAYYVVFEMPGSTDASAVCGDGCLIRMSVNFPGGAPDMTISWPENILDRKLIDQLADMLILSMLDTVSTGGSLISLRLPENYLNRINETNSVKTEVPDISLAGILEMAFRKYADKQAIIHKEKIYTYADIGKMSYCLAGQISGRSSVTAVLLFKSELQFISIYAVLLSGGCYMPLDTGISRDELEYCLNNTEASLLITSEEFRSIIPENFMDKTLFVSDIDLSRETDFEPVRTVNTDCHVIINTSGTTGKPKSVLLRDNGIVSCMLSVRERFGFMEGERHFAITNICHDMAIFDTIGFMFYGGCAVIPDPRRLNDPAHWTEQIKKYQVSIWESAPSFMEMLSIYRGLYKSEETYPSMRIILHGGEMLKVNVVSFDLRIFPNCRIYNVGGPSEGTIWNIIYPVSAEDIENGIIPYGVPFPNNEYHIFNDKYEECPLYTSGTLCCRGIGLSAGYKGDPGETARKFRTIDGERTYDTGDVGYRIETGDIILTGRKDFQVKIHGKRIELSGIEYVISEHPGIYSTSVIYIEELDKIACVYVSGSDIPAGELQTFMKNKLADYMIPKLFLRINALPLTRNGKTDRRKIKEYILKSSK